MARAASLDPGTVPQRPGVADAIMAAAAAFAIRTCLHMDWELPPEGTLRQRFLFVTTVLAVGALLWMGRIGAVRPLWGAAPGDDLSAR